MKRLDDNSLINDKAKRLALMRWIKTAKGKQLTHGGVGVILCMAWDAGYEAARRRFKPKEKS